MAELLEMAGVAQSRTTPYHPMGNGGTERFNRTLGGMMRSLPPRSKHKWPQMVHNMTFAYNCTQNETTGFAPFYLMFGRVPRLPVDLMFKNVLLDETICDYGDYVKSLAADLQTAMLLAQKNSEVERRHQAEQYDKKTKGMALSMGDRVLVANKGGRGKRKLADKWEPEVYTVVAAKPQCHIYRIRNRTGQDRTVHRNLLLQVNFLPLACDTDLIPDHNTCASSEASLSEMPEPDGSDSAVAEPSLNDGLHLLSEADENRTTSWVLEHSSAQSDDGGTRPYTSQENSSAPQELPVTDADGPHSPTLPRLLQSVLPHEGSVVSLPPVCTPSRRGVGMLCQSEGSLTSDHYTSRFGRVIRPVCRLIENMVQLEKLMGFEPSATIGHA